MENQGILLSPDEKVVKLYHCTKLFFPACDGFLSVTNKRVMFCGVSGDTKKSKFSSRIVNEVKLDSISGISSFYGGNLNLLMAIVGALMVIAMVAMIVESTSGRYFDGVMFGLSFLVGIIGAWLLKFCYRRTFFLKIFSSQATGAPISIGEGAGSIGGKNALMAITGAPTTQTDKMMRELGALIHDLQTKGDLAMADWKNRE